MLDKKIKREAIAYAKSMADWWRGAKWPSREVSGQAKKAAYDAHWTATGDTRGRARSMPEIATAWDRAVDLLKNGGVP